MPILYDGNKIIPAPLVDISENFITDGVGRILGAQYNITLNGTIVAFKGSPTSSGTWWNTSGYPADEVIGQSSRLGAILRKQEAIRKIFENQGRLLEIQPWDGTTPIKCNPQVLNINFPQGIWTEVCPYTINLSANQLYGYLIASGVTTNVTNLTNSWQIELGDTAESAESFSTFRVSHNVSAQGVLSYDINGNPSEPYQDARNWVQQRIGYDPNQTVASGALNVPSYLSAFNHVRSENTDQYNGVYSISENWILSSGNCLEDFSVSTQTSIDTGLTQVSVQGQLTGLETRDSNYQVTSSKYAAASGKFASISSNFLTRAQAYAGVTLNPIPTVSNVGRSPVAGVISYQYDYDNRPTNLIPGTRQENITVIDNTASDVFAAINVLGRTNGTLLQSLSTTSEKSRQLSIDLVVQPSSTLSISSLLESPFNTQPSQAVIESIIAAVRPSANYVFTVNPNTTWNPRTGQGSYNVTWVYNN